MKHQSLAVLALCLPVASWHLRTPICSFEEFGAQGEVHNEDLRPDTVVFRQDPVLVMQKQEANGTVSRILLFKKGSQRCEQHSLTRCKSVSETTMLKSQTLTAVNLCQWQKCRPYIELPLTYARSMLAAAFSNSLASEHNRGLLVGIGGSMIPVWLQEALQGEVYLDAVDVEPAILDAAPCFGFEQSSSNVFFQLSDGRQFLQQQAAQSYHFVLLDAFTDEGAIPPCLSTVEFVETVASKLTATGVAVFNSGPKDFEDLLAAIAAVFPRLALGDAPGLGNRLIAATVAGSVQRPLDGSLTLNHADLRRWWKSANFRWPGRSTMQPRRDAQWCDSGH